MADCCTRAEGGAPGREDACQTDISRFCLVAAQLEIQTHYFISPGASPSATPSSPPTEAPPPWLRRNTARVVGTSRALIDLALDLESRAHLLTHAPQWVLRSVLDASVFLVAVFAHPSWARHAEGAGAVDGQGEGANAGADDDGSLVRRACAAMLRCSVRDADLPHRVSVLLETFWAVRHLMANAPPAMHGPAPSAWPDRLGAGVTFWCLERLRLGLRAAQSSTDRVNRALDLIRRSPPPLLSAPRQVGASRRRTRTQAAHRPHPLAEPSRTNAYSGNDDSTAPSIPPANTTPSGAVAAGADSDAGLQATAQPGSNPFLDVDWSMFMDEFGWTGEDAVLLGLP